MSKNGKEDVEVTAKTGTLSGLFAAITVAAVCAGGSTAMAAECEGQVSPGTESPPVDQTSDPGLTTVRATDGESVNRAVEDCTASTTESAATQASTTSIAVSSRVLMMLNSMRRQDESSNQQTGMGAPRGGGASADEAGGLGNSGRLSVFAFDDYAKVDRETTAGGGAYDQKSNTIALGADYRINDSTFVGGSIASTDSDTDFKAILGNSDISTTLLGVHGAKYWGNSFVSSMLAVGQMDVDILRGDGSDFYTASTEGDFWFIDLSYGYEYSFASGARLTPMLRYINLSGDVDGYLERSASGMGTVRDVGDQNIDTQMFTASLSADYPMPQNWGVLLPNLRLDLISDLSDSYETSGQARNDIDGSAIAAISESSDDPDSFAVALAAGASAQFAHGLSAYLLYEKLFAHDFLDRDNLTLGVRYELP